MSEPAPPSSEPDTDRYLSVMSDIKLRLTEADRIMSGERLSVLQAEFVGLLLRRSIEMVVMSSLAANHAKVAEISTAFQKHKLNDAAKAVKAANPEYWPTPIQRTPDSTDVVIKISPLSEPWLRESEWRREWSYLSEQLLHAHNPFRDKPLTPVEELQEVATRLRSITDRLRALVQDHFVVIAGGTTGLLVRLFGPEEPIFLATLIRPQPLPKEDLERIRGTWG